MFYPYTKSITQPLHRCQQFGMFYPYTKSITQPLHTLHTGHVSATFSVSICCVRAGLTLHRTVSTLSAFIENSDLVPLLKHVHECQ